MLPTGSTSAVGTVAPVTSPLPGQPGFVVPAPSDRPHHTRRAVRVLLLDEDDRVLLIEDSDLGLDPVAHWWNTPGGGVDPGETDAEAVVRELHEETGLRVTEADLDGPLLERRVLHGWSDKVVDQDETFWAVRVPAFEVDTSGHTEEERMTVVGLTWWDLDALEATATSSGPSTCGLSWPWPPTATGGGTPPSPATRRGVDGPRRPPRLRGSTTPHVRVAGGGRRAQTRREPRQPVAP